MKALLTDDAAFEEAHWTVDQGLLANLRVGPEALRAIGEQLIAEAFDPLAQSARH